MIGDLVICRQALGLHAGPDLAPMGSSPLHFVPIGSLGVVLEHGGPVVRWLVGGREGWSVWNHVRLDDAGGGWC